MTHRTPSPSEPDAFSATYPSIARWVRGYGWIEVGEDNPGAPFVRALDEGGVIWDGEDAYPTLEAAWQALETALAAWFRREYGHGR